MMRCACFPAGRWLGLILLPLLLSGSVSAQSIDQMRSDDLLKVDLLYVGAHPDDESGVTATFAREVLDGGAKAGIVLITRGEGGGNAIGRELGPSLGILREAEIRRSAAEYGVDLVYFLDKTDFFYTLSDKATYDVWGHEDTLGRVVRLVRLLRPDVIVTMWPGPGTHGHHQAAARLATEAFAAAADPAQFPEQLDDEYLRTWQPVKLYYNTGRVGSFSIPTGDISPSRFMSYAEIKSLALRNFRSQGFDRRATVPPRGARAESFLLVKTLVPPSPEGLKTLLGGLEGPRDPGIVLGPPPSTDPLTIAMKPRSDIVRYRRWAEAHQVSWVAGLLPAALSIGSGMTGTLEAEVASRSPEGASGRIRLHLPDGWTDGPLEAVYEVAGRSAATGEGGTAGEGAATATATATVPFTFRVPEHVAQGSYRVRLTAASADPADRSAASDWTLEDGGVIDVLPVMDLSAAPGPMRIDGDLADWEGIETHAITSGHIWSGSLPGGDDDCSATFRVAYDRANLYVAVDVRDDAVVCNIAPDDVKGHWRSDAVEICVDPSGRSDNTLTVFKAGIFPGTTAGREPRAARDADARQGVIEKTAPGMRVASRFTGHGYVIETAVPWSDMPGGEAPPAGETIGFNLVIYDGDETDAGPGANIGKARLAWSYRPSAQALPYYYGRAVVR